MVRVELAVYDLSNGMASQLSEAILGQRIDGIWHTGVVVFGREYFFGGGIQNLPVGSFTTSNGLRPCQMLHLGDTTKTQAELENYLRSINHQYTQATYDLINHNCNNFSNCVAMFLLNQGIPEHIVDLPRIVFSTPGGMMLRPMIESMQSGISQNGGGMDPFGGGGGGSGTHPLAAMSSINSTSAAGQLASTSATTVAPFPTPDSHPSAQVTTTTTVTTFMPTPEEKAFVSADVDSNTLNALCSKILKFKSPDSSETLLGEADSVRLRSTIESLGSNSLHIFPHETFSLLGQVVQSTKPLQLAGLFILRLLALHLHKRDPSACSRDSAAYFACQDAAHSLLSMVEAAESGVFSSAAALVMAMCTLANMVSSHEGCDLLFRARSDQPADAAEGRVGTLVDACAWGLSHAKPEVRQMSATLGYNLALASTRGSADSVQSIVITQDVTPLPWRSLHDISSDDKQNQGQDKGQVSGGELHQHVVQILCAVMETLGDEADAVSLGRKLHAAYYVCAAGGAPAVELVSALGFDEHLQGVRDKHHLLSETDRKRLGNFELLLKAP